MAGRLNEFLERARQTPFAWGQFDCILFLANWSQEIAAGDPAAPFRSRYSSEFGAGRIIAKAGGLAALVAREFEPLGWMPTDRAERGDIGLVLAEVEDGRAVVGGLCVGDRWAVLNPAGLLIADFDVVAAWRHA